jgi:hypothetical protein
MLQIGGEYDGRSLRRKPDLLRNVHGIPLFHHEAWIHRDLFSGRRTTGPAGGIPSLQQSGHRVGPIWWR